MFHRCVCGKVGKRKSASLGSEKYSCVVLLYSESMLYSIMGLGLKDDQKKNKSKTKKRKRKKKSDCALAAAWFWCAGATADGQSVGRSAGPPPLSLSGSVSAVAAVLTQ